MAEFQKIAKERKRMCESKVCKECPLYNLTEGNYCGTKILNYAEESERIIMEWSAENPIKTNRDKFKEVFGLDYFDPLLDGGSAWLTAEYKGGRDEQN